MPNSDIPLLDMYRTMLTIRRFEEKCNYLFMQGRIPSTLHLYIGQEAVAVGVCAHLSKEDYILSTHRPHGHAIAKGVSLKSIMAELFAKRTGCCLGKGGSMHVGDVRSGPGRLSPLWAPTFQSPLGWLLRPSGWKQSR